MVNYNLEHLTNKYENFKVVINSHKNSKLAQKKLYENIIELGGFIK